MNGSIYRAAVFPAMETLSGTCISEKVRELEASQWWTRAKLLELQNLKLRALIEHAYANVPYYHRLFRQHHLRPGDIREGKDLRKLPVLTKEDIRKNISELVAVNLPRSRKMTTYSSGSTGEPLKYFLDKISYSAGWAQTFRCWGWAGFRIGDPYVKIGLESRNGVKKKVQDFLMNTQYIGFSGVHKSNLPEIIARIRTFQPRIIRSNTDFIYPLAKMMEAEDLSYSGATVTTTASILFPEYRSLIEKQFTCRVMDAYGGEGTPVSFQCEKCEHYHIAEEDVIVEFMKGNEYVGEEEPGKIVITNLNNFVMPLIHYDLNDIGQFLDDTCSCGRNLALMKSIEGRDNDLVKTRSGEFIPVHFFSSLFRETPGIDQYQIIQESIDQITFRIVKNNTFSESETKYLSDRVQEKSGGEIAVNFQYVSEIPVSGRSGKRRYVISRVPFPMNSDGLS